jgi:hypothetical protein
MRPLRCRNGIRPVIWARRVRERACSRSGQTIRLANKLAPCMSSARIGHTLFFLALRFESGSTNSICGAAYRGFALTVESFCFGKRTKPSALTSGPCFAAVPSTPVPWGGYAPTRHPWRNGARPASMPVAPPHDTCAQPPDARLAVAARSRHEKAKIKSKERTCVGASLLAKAFFQTLMQCLVKRLANKLAPTNPPASPAFRAQTMQQDSRRPDPPWPGESHECRCRCAAAAQRYPSRSIQPEH